MDRKLSQSPFLIELMALSNLLGHPIQEADLQLTTLNPPALRNATELTGYTAESSESSIFGMRLAVDYTCCVCLVCSFSE